MGIEINGILIETVLGDITELDTDAIVNPANTRLILGGGVAGAIRSKGGGLIQRECDALNGCPLGEAKATSGGNLKADYVIHAVGPVYGTDPEPEKYLKSAIMKSLEMADNMGLKSIALPAVSTGIFRYPLEEAAEIIVGASAEFARKCNSSINKIVLCLFTEKDYNVFKMILEKM